MNWATPATSVCWVLPLPTMAASTPSRTCSANAPLTLSSLYQPNHKSLRTATHTRVLSPHETQPASRVCPAVHPGKRPLPALRRLGPFGKAMPGSSAEADGLGGLSSGNYRLQGRGGDRLSLGARVLSWVYFGDRYGIHRKATGRGNGGKKKDINTVEDDLFRPAPFRRPLAGINRRCQNRVHSCVISQGWRQSEPDGPETCSLVVREP